MSTALTDFTFKDTGISVKIRKVSPMLASDIANAFPEPEPPLQEVDYGGPDGKVMEPNYQHPTYIRAMKERQQKVIVAIQRAMISRGVVVEGDEWLDEVKRYRDEFREIAGTELQDDDLLVYVLRICVGTEDDLEDLLAAMTRRSQPTQEEVDKSKSSFRR